MSHKACVLQGRLESFNLILAIGVLLITVFLTVVHTYQRLEFELEYRTLILYLLFDRSHIFFTFWALFIIPELREFTMFSISRKSRWLIYCLALIFGIGLYESLKFNLLSSEPNLFRLVKSVVLLLWAQHSVRQFFGFTMLYNLDGIKFIRSDNLNLFHRWRSRERLAFHIFIAAAIIQRMLPFTPWASSLHLKWPMFWILISLGLIVVGCSNQFPQKELWRNKRLYLVRIFLHPLMALDQIAFIAVAIIHGFEYLFICMNMAMHSASKQNKWILRSFPIIGVVLGFVFLLFLEPRTYHYFFGPTDFIRDVWITAAAAVFILSANLHYYLDSVLFKLRDTGIQRFVLPLLHPPK